MVRLMNSQISTVPTGEFGIIILPGVRCEARDGLQHTGAGRTHAVVAGVIEQHLQRIVFHGDPIEGQLACQHRFAGVNGDEGLHAW